MKDVHIVLGVVALACNLVAGLYGAWCWRHVESKGLFWMLLRAGQVSILLEAALGGILAATGHHVSSLHLLYGFLPIAVSFVGELLRISAAQLVLEARGLAGGKEVAELPPSEQRLIVLTIIQREVGVMAIAALVIFGLLIRAMGTGG